VSDLAEKIRTAIQAKEVLARAAASTTYNDDGERVAIPESLDWSVQDDDNWGTTWVGDGARENVALASDVDMISETWDQIPPGRVEFIADNDPASVLRRCAADREIVEWYSVVSNSAVSDGTKVALTKVIKLLARGYGVQPTPGDDHA
jgi:Family of unknown function (DUF6221)